MTLSKHLQRSAEKLKRAGVMSHRLDAEILTAAVLGISRSMLIAHDLDELDEMHDEKVSALIERRIRREPVAYILEEKEFYGLPFYVTPDVLIPRPETEHLVEEALSHLKDGGGLLDICTGSGAVAIAVKHSKPELEVTGSDISAKALDVAKKNCRLLLSQCTKINFLESDLFQNIEGTYDVITANPPYIGHVEKQDLEPELFFEPSIALFCEARGEELPHLIIKNAKQYLASGGVLLMEIHAGKEEFIHHCAVQHSYSCLIKKDYAGLPRVAVLRPL